MSPCSGSDPTGNGCVERAIDGLSLCRHCLAEERLNELAAKVKRLEEQLARRAPTYYPR
jgi:hypothetical protein